MLSIGYGEIREHDRRLSPGLRSSLRERFLVQLGGLERCDHLLRHGLRAAPAEDRLERFTH
jgi:hypothetical protein